jgi:hypothetical protein
LRGPMILLACHRVTICRAGATGAGEGNDMEDIATLLSNTIGDGPLLGEDSAGEDVAMGEWAGVKGPCGPA